MARRHNGEDTLAAAMHGSSNEHKVHYAMPIILPSLSLSLCLSLSLSFFFFFFDNEVLHIYTTRGPQRPDTAYTC